MSNRNRRLPILLPAVLIALSLAAEARADQFTCPANGYIGQVITGASSGVGPLFAVYCSATSSPIKFFAYRISDNPAVAQILSQALASAIQRGAGAITIYYDPNDLSGAAWGCRNADCRKLDTLYAY
jgi:hypothetical protein